MKKILLGLVLILSSCSEDNNITTPPPTMLEITFQKTINYEYGCFEDNPILIKEDMWVETTSTLPYNETLINQTIQDTISKQYYTFGGCGTWVGKIRLIELSQKQYIITE